MVAPNQGISILPLPIAVRFHSDNIRRIRLTEPEFPWEIAIIVPKERYVSGVMDAFIRFACDSVHELAGLYHG